MSLVLFYKSILKIISNKHDESVSHKILLILLIILHIILSNIVKLTRVDLCINIINNNI